MESTSSCSDAAASSSPRRHRSTSATSRRRAATVQGAEPCDSSSSDRAEHVSGSRAWLGHDNGNLAHGYSKQWNMQLCHWIKAFLLSLLVLCVISTSHLDRALAESVWPANGIHGTDLCTPERRCKRHPKAAGKPRTPCWEGPCWQSAQASDADHDVVCSSDDDGEVVQCSSWQHDDVPPVPLLLSENLLLPLHQSADETMDASSSPTITYEDDLGAEDDISSMEVEQLVITSGDDDDAASVSGNRSIPDGIDDCVEEELTGFDISADASIGVEQPAVNDQIGFDEPWSSIPGLRFLPTDLEIVLHCLKHKILNSELPVHNEVREGVDVHRTNADEITLDSNDEGKEQLGFFFVRKDQAYTNGCWYPTPGGYWKMRRGQPAAIRHGGRVVAFKTSMDYVRGRAPRGRRTPWSMSEYALNTWHHDLRNLAQPTMNSFVVCKVWKRTSMEVKKKTSVLRRFGLKRRVDKDRATRPKVRRLVGGAVRGGEILGKRKRPEL